MGQAAPERLFRARALAADPRPPKASRREPETLVRVAICVVSAALVSLGWILASDMDPATKAWGIVLFLSFAGTTTVVVGYTRVEVAKMRADLVDLEKRLLSALDTAGRPEVEDVDSNLPPQLTPDPVISHELRIFLQGRESAYREDEDEA
ncbi:hypothetical protein [Hamadaea tsunoensis]|uniref:hypothetical protein n=1 Tax=Hamadaea tsunoensis TaxID=53368 RepID=UPI0003FF2185|nr:hypothetical protein [Hamadaea tsunoensis]